MLSIIGRSEREWIDRATSGNHDESFGTTRRSYEVALARATREIGWNARGSFQEHVAAYHSVARALRWKRFCIEIRDQILAVLAEAFAKAGKPFNERPVLTVRNLPTLSDVDDAEKKLRAGGVGFDELLKPFSHRLD